MYSCVFFLTMQNFVTIKSVHFNYKEKTYAIYGITKREV